ncbi:MAG: hypothetical protein JWL64_1829 [Frankiales bacterium]|nr:hypothetical protein [Frankiales bacterium]
MTVEADWSWVLGMRWQALFDDVEAQFAAAERQDWDAEVRDRTRRELATLRTVDRLRPVLGQPVELRVLGTGALPGTLREVGPDWLLVEGVGARAVLVSLRSVLSVTGVGRTTAAPGSEGAVARRLTLPWALRGLVRSRTGVAVTLIDGSVLAGTLDRVGADHADIAEHPPGEQRRAPAVQRIRLVPVTALGTVRTLS